HSLFYSLYFNATNFDITRYIDSSIGLAVPSAIAHHIFDHEGSSRTALFIWFATFSKNKIVRRKGFQIHLTNHMVQLVAYRDKAISSFSCGSNSLYLPVF